MWGASPAFRHVTVEPTGTVTLGGANEKSWISASTPVAEAAGGGVGVGTESALASGLAWASVAAGVGSTAESPVAPVPFTTTLPVISGWIAHRYENVPACLNVRFHDPPSPIGPLLNAPSSAVTVCARSSSLRNVTEPPAAIVTVPGPNARPAIETEADVGSWTSSHRPTTACSWRTTCRRPRSARNTACPRPRARRGRCMCPLPSASSNTTARLEIVGVEFGGPGLRAHPMPLVVGVHEPDRRAGGDRQLGRRKAIGDPDRDGRGGSSDGHDETAATSATSEARTRWRAT